VVGVYRTGESPGPVARTGDRRGGVVNKKYPGNNGNRERKWPEAIQRF